MPSPDPPEPFEAEVRELVERLRPRLARICRDHGLGPGETEEVLYEGFVFLFQRWRGLQDREGWLLQVVEETCAARVAAAEEAEAEAEAETEGSEEAS